MKRKWLFPLSLSLFCFVHSGYASGYGFSITSAELLGSHKGYLFSADVDYKLSPRASDALLNGVPLTIVVKVQVDRYRKVMWNQKVFTKKIVYRVTYQSLRKSYRVYDHDLGRHQYFADLRSALDTIGKIRGFIALDIEDVDLDAAYSAKVKVFLDIEALPLPLRSIAYLIPQWHISSGWYKWSLDLSNRQ